MAVSSILIFAGLFTGRQLADTTISFDSSRNPQQISAAVADAASRAGWSVQVASNHAIRATHRLNQYSATVMLTAEGGAVTLHYEDSANLQFKQSDSGPQIHKLYYEWTKQLTKAVNTELASLCPDMSEFRSDAFSGFSQDEMEKRIPGKGARVRDLAVMSSSGTATGYHVREFRGYLSGQTQACGPVSYVYYDRKLTSVVGSKMEVAAILAYSDLLRYLVKVGAIPFSDGELERMSLRADSVMNLDPPRREELLRFVEWQAQRFERKETTEKEYEFLLAQKEAEIRERQGTIDQKERELQLLRMQGELQAASIDNQRQQLQVQRAMAIGQAIQNAGRTTTYSPVIRLSTTCNTSASFGTVTTTCY